MAAQPTSNISFQNFFSATLTADITATSTDIFLDNIPNGTEGFLVVDPLSSGREIIYFNSKGASKVVCPSAADGRGQDGTSASSHLTGTTVIMAPIAAFYTTLLNLFTTSPQGWSSLAGTFTANTYNGNRSYTVSTSTDQSAVLSPGMRLRSTCTVAGPVQCASLNGSTQFFSKTTPAGLTATDDFVVGGWIKLTNYPTAGDARIMTRLDGTSGWQLSITTAGQVSMTGYNGGSANFSQVLSTQSVPLNRWVHIAAQLDMSSFTNTSTTSYIMIDAIDVVASLTRGGTNPTALSQGTGPLNVGTFNGGQANTFFPGKLAQVFVTSAKLTQAQVRGLCSQGLTAADMTTYNIVSAFSLSGANGLTDINTANANNLATNGAATTTTADSFRGQNSSGTISASLDYAIVTAVTSSTLTYQVPEGCTVPTSGGISAMSYSTYKTPFGLPADTGRWAITYGSSVGGTQGTPAANSWYNIAQNRIVVPVGVWSLSYMADYSVGNATNLAMGVYGTLSTNASAQDDRLVQTFAFVNASQALHTMHTRVGIYRPLSAQTTFYLLASPFASGYGSIGIENFAPMTINAEFALL